MVDRLPTELPVHALVPDPDQPRTDFDEVRLQELAQSLAVHGVVEPLIVTENPDPGEREAHPYTILAGERRWRAARLAGLASVPVVVRLDPLTRDERLLLQLAENDEREDLSLLDRARAYQRALEISGLSKKDFAAKYRKSQPWLSNLLAIAAAEGLGLQALEERLLNHAETARLFQKLPSGDQRRLLRTAEESGHPITLGQVRKAAEKRRAASAHPERARAAEPAAAPPLPASSPSPSSASDSFLDLTPQAPRRAARPEKVALGEVTAEQLLALLELLGLDRANLPSSGLEPRSLVDLFHERLALRCGAPVVS